MSFRALSLSVFAVFSALGPTLVAEPAPGSATAPAVVPAAKPWPALVDLEKLYQDKNYARIRVTTAGCVYDAETHSNLTGAKLVFFRGDALFREVYQARAQQTPEATTTPAPGRASFELSLPANLNAALATALADLATASELDTLHNGSPYLAADPGLRMGILRATGFASLEKALYVTQASKDFYAASYALRALRQMDIAPAGAAFEEGEPELRGTPVELAAEIIALVGEGKESDARALFIRWRKSRDSNLRPDLAVVALASAYDLVGDYERTRALLITMTAGQIRADGGKFDPARHAAARAATRAHLNNLNFAYQQKPSTDAPALRRARVAGAMVMQGTLGAEDRAYILALPEIEGTSVALRRIRLQVESEAPAEQALGLAALDARLKLNPRDDAALALRGRVRLRAGDTEAALADLGVVIRSDVALASIFGALSDRAAAYTKLGRAAEAADDTRMDGQLEKVLAALASPQP